MVLIVYEVLDAMERYHFQSELVKNILFPNVKCRGAQTWYFVLQIFWDRSVCSEEQTIMSLPRLIFCR